MARGIVKGGLNDSGGGSGGDTSDATASAADILSPKTAYIATGKVSGTLVLPNAGFIMDRRIEVKASAQPRNNLITPFSLIGRAIDSDVPPLGQIWPGGYPRSPGMVADFPNQLIFDGYGTAPIYLHMSAGRFRRYASTYSYIYCESITYDYVSTGGVWLLARVTQAGGQLARYGSYLYSISPIYTDDTYTTVYTAANVTIDEGS